MHRIIFIVFFWSINHWCLGVELGSFRNFNSENGIPTSRIYSLHEDSEGFLWIGTDAGIVRYDGNHFDHISQAKGAPGADILLITQDGKGRIWFFTYNGRIGYYKEGQFYNNGNTDFLDSQTNAAPILRYFHDSKLRTWLVSGSQGIICIDGDKITRFSQVEGYDLSSVGTFWETNDGSIWVNSHKDQKFQIPEFKIKVFSYPFCPIGQAKGLSQPSSNGTIAHCGNFLQRYTLNDKGKVMVKPLVLIPEDVRTNGIFQEGDSIVWLCTKNNGAWAFRMVEDSLILENKILEGIGVSSFCIDSFGNRWFGSLDKGLFRELPFHTSYFEVASAIQNKPTVDFKQYENGDGFLLLSPTEIFRVLNGTYTHIEVPETPNRGSFIGFANDPKGVFIISERAVFEFRDGKLNTIFKWAPAMGGIISIKDFHRDTNGNQYILSNWGFHKIVGDELEEVNLGKTLPQGIRPTKLYCDMAGRFWLGTTQGLFVGIGESFIKIPEIEAKVTSIVPSDSQIWVSTRGEGVFCMGEGYLRRYTTKSGLSSDYCNQLMYDKTGIWIGTDEGLNKLMFSEVTGGLPGIAKIELASFSCLSRLSWISRFKEKPLVALKGSIVEINATGMSRKNSPPSPSISLLYLSSDNKWLFSDKDVQLPTGVSQVKLNLRSISLSPFSRALCQYRTSKSHSWETSGSGEVLLLNLSPGIHKVEVRALDAANGLYSNIKQIDFLVPTPFWKTPWFISLLGLLLILGTSGVVMATTSRRHKKEKLLRLVADSRIATLSAQMNPHFVFNALNSIQAYIIENQGNLAISYLSRFGKLIRRLLEFSDLDHIALREELISIRFYLDLEKMRTGEKFDYSIKCSPEVNLDNTLIPPFITQPILENAIWHAFSNMETKGEIRIEVCLEKQFWSIKITDNGIGRARHHAKQNRISKPNRSSKGLAMIGERLNLLKLSYPHSGELAIIDLTDTDKNPAGTLVILKFPIA